MGVSENSGVGIIDSTSKGVLDMLVDLADR